MSIIHPLMPRFPTGGYRSSSKRNAQSPRLHRTAGGVAFSLKVDKSKKKTQSFFASMAPCHFTFMRYRLALKAQPPVPSALPLKVLKTEEYERIPVPPTLSEHVTNIERKWDEQQGPARGNAVQFLVAFSRKSPESIFSVAGFPDDKVKEMKQKISWAYTSAPIGTEMDSVERKVKELLEAATVQLHDKEWQNKRPGREDFARFQYRVNNREHLIRGFRVFPRAGAQEKNDA